MARKCQISGKKPLSGNNVSHAKNRTKRRQLPNLQTKKYFIPELGKTVKLKICQQAIRTIDKIGLSTYLKKENINLKHL